MNRKQKIDFIYKKIADKTLSFGCVVKWEEAYYTILELIPGPVNWIKRAEVMNWYRWYGKFWPVTLIPIGEYKIIWHPVMIWDVLKWIDKNCVNWVLTCSKCGSEVWYEDWIAYCSDWDCDNDKFEDFKWLYKTNLSIEFYDIKTEYVNKDDFLWQKLDKPIEDQSDECVNFVYEMIKEK